MKTNETNETRNERPQNVIELIVKLKQHWRIGEIESIHYTPLFTMSALDTTGNLSIRPNTAHGALSPSIPVGMLKQIIDYDHTACVEFKDGAFLFLLFKRRPSSSDL